MINERKNSDGNHSYREALLSKTTSVFKNKKVKAKDSATGCKKKASVDTIFPKDSLTKDLLSFFKRLGDIKDIILPKKIDKYGRIFGFVKVRSREEAG